MTIIELFAGVGTQFQALLDNDSHANCIGISEIDARPLRAHEALFGESHNFGDITKIESLPKADIWTYSFPCTDLSVAGDLKGFEGDKSSLIYEVYRLLQTSEKPKVLLMENVANLASAKFMSQFQNWIDTLDELGYVSAWKKIKAYEYGGVTIRNRIFMISVLNGKEFVFPKTTGSAQTIGDILEPADEDYYAGEYGGPIDLYPKTYSKTCKLGNFNDMPHQGYGIYSPNGLGVTLTATGGGKAGSSGGLYTRGRKIYKLSPIEMCKAMGWTKEEAEKICSVLTPREVGFVMGNAIDRKVLSALFAAIIEQYFEQD